MSTLGKTYEFRAGNDAGMLMISDPCYTMGETAPTWDEFIKRLDFNKEINEPLGEGLGVCFQTPFGDGNWRIIVEMSDNHEDMVKKVTIDMSERSENW